MMLRIFSFCERPTHKDLPRFPLALFRKKCLTEMLFVINQPFFMRCDAYFLVVVFSEA